MENPDKDIAIVGVACRFPGEATNPDGLLSMLRTGRDAWNKIPKDRFDVAAYHHPNPERLGSIVAQGGYFLKEDPARWDAPFFTMAPSEARSMDPQQRLLLEVAFEGFENAGIPIENIVGTDTSVHVGCFTHDYDLILSRDMDTAEQHHVTGVGAAMLSNRLSWFYDLRGPSLTLDTACSSSLLALHLACQSILGKESSMAVVGGVALMLDPVIMRGLTSLHFLSPDSRCFSFDDRANGYARGEGLGVVILKSVKDALRDGDTIRAVIRASATNQDGRTPGITLPSTEAQASLIRAAYKSANLALSDTQYFEAHGTGTPAGDPLELAALGATFGAQAAKDSQPLLVGSIKTNIGHLEGCAGLAGVIKAILSLESGFVFPSLNYETANPRITLKEWNLKIPTELTPWPASGLRRASVNSFGYGGSNVHVVLDDAYHYLNNRGLVGFTHTRPQVPDLAELDCNGHVPGHKHAQEPLTPPESEETDVSPQSHLERHLFILSGPDKESVSRLGICHANYVDQLKFTLAEPGSVWDSLAHTLCNRRSQFLWRQGVVASATGELTVALRNIEASRVPKTPPVISLVFTGQGAQWVGMGKELMRHEAFANSVSAANTYLLLLGASWSVLGELDAPESTSRINEAELSQPLCTILQIALVDLIRYWGVKVSAVVGHSSGEIAAAYTSGALTATDAYKVAYFRGRAAIRIPELAPQLRGGMLAVGLSKDAVQVYIDQANASPLVVLACINSHKSTTLSGDATALEKMEEKLKADDIFTRRLKVDTAYHSYHMQAVAEEYRNAIADIVPRQTTECTFISSVTGRQVEGLELGASYWVANMTSPVEFLAAMEFLIPDLRAARRRKQRRDGSIVNTIVEIGPAGALQSPIKQILSRENMPEDLIVHSILARNKNAVDTSLDLMRQLWVRGLKGLDFTRINSPALHVSPLETLVDLLSYPWNHNMRYWTESNSSRNRRKPRASRLDLLGRPVEDWNANEPHWKNRIRISEQPWVAQHIVQDAVLFPASGYVCAALEGARQICDKSRTLSHIEMRDITISRALQVGGDDDSVSVELITAFKYRKLGLRSPEAPWIEWTIYSDSDRGYMEHCSGLLQLQYEQDASEIERGQEEQIRRRKLSDAYHESYAQDHNLVDSSTFYDHLGKIGLHYGPLFQGIKEARNGVNSRSCWSLVITDTRSEMPMKCEDDHLIHPTTLDACFQTLFAALGFNKTDAMVPTAVNSIRIAAHVPRDAGTRLRGLSTCTRKSFRTVVGSVYVSEDNSDAPLIELEDLTCTEVSDMNPGQAGPTHQSDQPLKFCSYVHWEPDAYMMRQDMADLQMEQIMRLPNEHPVKYRLDCFTTRLTELIAVTEKLSVIFAKRALASLTPNVESKLPHHLSRYLGWLRQFHSLAAVGGLKCQHGSVAWMQMSEQEEDEYIDSISHTSIDTKLLTAVGNNLPAILDGSVIPLSVMMKDNMWTEYCARGSYYDVMADLIGMTIKIRGHKQPDQQILEIGAGSAGTSYPILKHLGSPDSSTLLASRFVFTDISQGFFRAAQTLLDPWAAICEYKCLDIESDPILQGFEAESFDVIVAGNVLHTVRDIEQSLKNIKTLLKPDGQLILAELTVPCNRMSMMLGILPGWWMSEQEGRRDWPGLSDEAWKATLAQAGYTVDYCFLDNRDASKHTSSLISASIPASNVQLPFDKAIVVHSDNTSESLQILASNFKKELKEIGLEADIMTLSQAFKTQAENSHSLRHKVAVISLLEAESPLLFNIQESQFDMVRQLVVNSAAVVWVTRGGKLEENDPSFRLIDGVFRVTSNEEDATRLRRIDLPKSISLTQDSTCSLIIKSFKILFPGPHRAPESEVVITSGRRYMIPRLYDAEERNSELSMLSRPKSPEVQYLHQNNRPLQATMNAPGILDSLCWVDDSEHLPFAEELGPDEVEILNRATALNFKDVMVAMGFVPDKVLGSDFAGVVARVGSAVTNIKPGDRVTTMTWGAFRTHIRVHWRSCQLLPQSMSFEDAATLPLIYITAFQALVEIGRLKQGETVLIHAGAGGLGQAAIQLAQYIGAEIYITVGSLAKKKLIMDTYRIPEDHIFNSRDLTFAPAVLRSTNGKGVDVILNSLAGEGLRLTWNCIKSCGRFIDVGKRDILGNTGLEMMPFLRNASFSGVNIDTLYSESVERVADIFSKVFELVRAGHLTKVTPVVVYAISDLERALRVMQQGKHSGKIVLTMQDDKAMVPVIPRDPTSVEISKTGTYLLVGGLGGLGRVQANWLAYSGARFLAFVSRSGASSEAAKQIVKHLEQLGVTVKVYKCDIADQLALSHVLNIIVSELPPIKGVIQGAMVLSDRTYRNMTFQEWTAATRPKVQGSWNLHQLLPDNLDFFVMMSSLTGLAGSRGQSNYGAGNTFQDALAHHRRSLGLPATTIDLGIIKGFGYVEESKGSRNLFDSAVYRMPGMRIEEDVFTSILKFAIAGVHEGNNRKLAQIACGAGTGGTIAAAALAPGEWYWYNDVLFAMIARLDTLKGSHVSKKDSTNLQAALAAATSLESATSLVYDALTARLAQAMNMSAQDLDSSRPIVSYGVDSLIAVEMRSWISRELKGNLSVFELMSPISLTQLASKIARSSSLLTADAKSEEN